MSIASTVANAPHEAGRIAIILARLGLVARGVVYLIIGGLAFMAAFGNGGQATDRQGALEKISQQQYGEPLLWVLAAGIFGYILWRWGQAIFDLDHEGTSGKAIGKRIGYFGGGVAYAGFLAATIRTALGSSVKGGDQSTQDWTAKLLDQPFGRWLTGIVAAVIVGIAIAQFVQAAKCMFARDLRGGNLTAEQEKWAIRAGRAGHAARGVAFLLIGWFMAQAAWQSQASEAGGMAQALETLARQPYGTWLLGAVGAGLACFGLYSFVEARYRQIHSPV